MATRERAERKEEVLRHIGKDLLDKLHELADTDEGRRDPNLAAGRVVDKLVDSVVKAVLEGRQSHANTAQKRQVARFAVARRLSRMAGKP